MERLWSKSFISLTVAMLFLFTGFYLLLPTLPLYIREMGGNETQIGLAAGVFTLAAVVFRPLVGGLLDRYGRRPFILWGLVLFTVCMYLYDWVGGVLLLLALRLMHGMTWAVSTTAVGTAVTDIIPSTRRGEGMGWYGMSMTLAMAVGPLLGIWIIHNQTYGNLFLIATGLSCVALVLTFAAKMPFQITAGPGRIQLFEKSLVWVMVSIFFLAVSYGGITTFLPLFAEAIEVNPGTFFLVFALTLTLSRPAAGKLSDRYGEIAVIIPALIVTVAALLVLSTAGGLGGIITAAVLYGIGFGAAQPALQAATLRIAHPERKGVANASFFTAFDLGIAMGAIMLGAVSQSIGYEALFIVSAVSVVLALVVFAVFARAAAPSRTINRRGKSMSNISNIVRIGFGIMLFGIGVVTLLGLMPEMEYAQPAAQFMTALTDTGYMMVIVSILKVATGLSLLTGRLVPLALVVFMPISINMVLFHAFLDPAAVAPALFILAVNSGLLAAYRTSYMPMVRKSSAGTVRSSSGYTVESE